MSYTIDDIKARVAMCKEKYDPRLAPCEHCSRLGFLLEELDRQSKYIVHIEARYNKQVRRLERDQDDELDARGQ